MGKNHNLKYIEKLGLQNPLRKFSLVSILPRHIIIEFLFHKKNYMKMHEVHIH
jgi:hypothetical protein